MNTHDKYELPPLPKASKMYDIPGYDEEELKDYARAAIELYQRRIEELESQLEAIGAGGVTQGQRLVEADRQRRGEPVPHDGYQPRPMLGPMPPPPPPKGLKPRELVDKFGFLVTPTSSNGDATTERSVDYKMLFEQMCERCDALDAKLAEYSEREPVARVNDDGFIVETGLGLAPGTLLYTAPEPAEPAREPGNGERAAQGLPPYSPRHLTEEEWNRLTENGRKAWGKKPDEPVRVPPCET